MPARINVVQIDTSSGIIQIELTGPSRPPEPRLFVLTDDRGRRFVPALASCDPAAADKETAGRTGHKPSSDEPSEANLAHWWCRLTVAPGYRRAVLTGVSMEWGDRVVHALPGQVKARWAAARLSPAPTAESAAGDDDSQTRDTATDQGGARPSDRQPPPTDPAPPATRRDDEPDYDEHEPDGPE
jgi:hypothetical protein